MQPAVGPLQLPPGQVRHAWYEVQKPLPDWALEQYCPSPQAELEVQGPPGPIGKGMPNVTGLQV